MSAAGIAAPAPTLSPAPPIRAGVVGVYFRAVAVYEQG